MGKFTVLGNTHIQELLIGLSKAEVEYFLKELEDCLISYSNGNERQYQPDAGIINRPDGQKILFRPFTSSETVGTKIIVHPAPISNVPSPLTDEKSKQQTSLNGVLVLCDKAGRPAGFLNAEEVTGYRTSLSVMIPFVHRTCTEKIIVFGAGKQALWHTRLAFALRGTGISLVTIVNRSESRAQELITIVKEENKTSWGSSCKFEFLESSKEDEVQLRLADADVVFCTVASRKPLFSLGSLELDARKGRYPLITAVGSWQSDMIEIHPAIMQHVVNSKCFNASNDTRGSVIVDDAKAALTHSGEIVQSGLSMPHMLEIGKILSCIRDSQLSKDQIHWLAEGLIIYKSIGVSLSDLAAGKAILALAEKKQLGTHVTGF